LEFIDNRVATASVLRPCDIIHLEINCLYFTKFVLCLCSYFLCFVASFESKITTPTSITHCIVHSQIL